MSDFEPFDDELAAALRRRSASIDPSGLSTATAHDAVLARARGIRRRRAGIAGALTMVALVAGGFLLLDGGRRRHAGAGQRSVHDASRRDAPHTVLHPARPRDIGGPNTHDRAAVHDTPTTAPTEAPTTVAPTVGADQRSDTADDRRPAPDAIHHRPPSPIPHRRPTLRPQPAVRSRAAGTDRRSICCRSRRPPGTRRRSRTTLRLGSVSGSGGRAIRGSRSGWKAACRWSTSTDLESHPTLPGPASCHRYTKQHSRRFGRDRYRCQAWVDQSGGGRRRGGAGLRRRSRRLRRRQSGFR